MSEDTKRKLSYDPASIPLPVTEAHAYAHATLIETRLLRMATERLASVLEKLVETPKSTTKK